MNITVDSEGTRWFEARNGEMTGFVPVVDIAPPKVRLPELGSQMLRAWLLAFRDPALIGEADSAVSYFCTEFAGSRHCDELRWVAAERFGSLGRRDGNEDAMNRARKLYATIRDGKGPIAAEAAGALNGLSEPNGGRQRGPGSGSKKTAPGRAIAYASGREYALVDKAEVQVRVPNLKSLSTGTVVRAAIAREIQINGKVAVPANAICVMRIADLDSANSHLTIQLTALEFANRRYEVSTVPQKIPSSGALVVFPLEASLLIGK